MKTSTGTQDVSQTDKGALPDDSRSSIGFPFHIGFGNVGWYRSRAMAIELLKV